MSRDHVTCWKILRMKRLTSTPLIHERKKKTKRTGDYQKGREMSRQPKSELKAFDIPQTTKLFKEIATPPTFDLLNVPVNGPELYQRVGRKV